jgi:hypothetical protein
MTRRQLPRSAAGTGAAAGAAWAAAGVAVAVAVGELVAFAATALSFPSEPQPASATSPATVTAAMPARVPEEVIRAMLLALVYSSRATSVKRQSAPAPFAARG